ncbi:SH3 domain-containing protein [Paracoccus jeotgali]|uniref:SH3 domain-containing protein n=1 Tax=Paracoccus jeotgali TaxID=2065379 RepID=UPI0028AA2E76|nr:hypothetical protein [Paracoccus jeotgali]
MRKLLVAAVMLLAGPALAEIDGHGPDAWRVQGVAGNDVLNMRMGPGTNYPVIDRLAPNASGLQLVTCVPLLIEPYNSALTEAQRAALPQRWCLMRSADLTRAGWVAQRFITPDQGGAAAAPAPAAGGTRAAQTAAASPRPAGASADPASDPMIAQARDLVREVYDKELHSPDSPLDPAYAGHYFTSDIVRLIDSNGVEAHPLFNAQDFDVTVSEPQPDPDTPMLRGTIFINVDFTNFGRPQRAVFSLRADPERPGAPLRIFNIDHGDWSFP